MDESIWFPHIDREVCTGCGLCVLSCPTGALGLRGGKAALIHPDRCIYCADCEAICPVGAIELPYLVCKSETHRKSTT